MIELAEEPHPARQRADLSVLCVLDNLGALIITAFDQIGRCTGADQEHRTQILHQIAGKLPQIGPCAGDIGDDLDG